ncbi:MAG TPA: hypothetical protein VFV96_15145 [Verrucomicrobiae bacterium]|nr:hypothetical protein [Verrucomicrobiae bacterium]
MNTLYPIIRRKRRPLFVADKPPVIAGNVEPAKAVATKPAEAIPTAGKPQTSDDQTDPTSES